MNLDLLRDQFFDFVDAAYPGIVPILALLLALSTFRVWLRGRICAYWKDRCLTAEAEGDSDTSRVLRYYNEAVYRLTSTVSGWDDSGERLAEVLRAYNEGAVNVLRVYRPEDEEDAAQVQEVLRLAENNIRPAQDDEDD